MATAILPLTLMVQACHQKAAAPAAPAPAVTIAKVRKLALEGGFSASGRLKPREEVSVGTELSGYRIARVLVEEGAQVRAGEVLAILDDTLLRSQIAQARAQLVQQQVAAQRARDQAGRVQGLDNQGVLSQEAILERRSTARSQEAAVKVAQAQLDDLVTRDTRLTIRAPFSGRVLERTAKPGDTASAGNVLFSIARDDDIELYAEVPEGAMGGIAVGDPVQVTLASGKILKGTVRLMGARVNDQTGLSIVRVKLPLDPALRAGGFARAQFTGESPPVDVVPEKAVQFGANGASIFMLDAQDHAHQVAVRTGRRAAGLVELVSGAQTGKRVVLGGSAFLLDGDQVRIAKEVLP